MHDELTFENCSHSKDPIVGCALEGVATVLAGIRDVSIVIHSPQGCSATVALGYDNQEIDFTRRKTACTRLFETDIIMGASDKLKDLILQADKTFASKVTFVVGTCAADIIGEDMEGICRVMQPKVGSRLIPVFAGGFRGNAYDGMDLGLEALVQIMKDPGGEREKRTVNLIAPQATLNPTWWADLAWVKEMLAAMGVSVQCVLTREASMHELRHASFASANILLSHDVGYGLARKMEESFGIPLILNDLPLPIGLGNTARWLTALGERFGAEAKAKAIISQGEAKVVDVLRRRGLMIIPRYRNCRIAVSADATFAIGLTRMLFEELEMLPELILMRSGRPEAKAVLAAELEDLGISPKKAFKVDGYQIKEALAGQQPHAVLGSAWERYLAQELGIQLAFDVLTPTNRDVYVDRAYFGYDGMLNMLEVVANDFERALRSKAIAWEQYDMPELT
jgi:light-independent protochlorophyllide reductase B subunit